MTRFTHPDTHPLLPAEQHLRAVDPLLASLIDLHSGPCELADNLLPRFHVLVKTILDQQLSVKAAACIGSRLLDCLGDTSFRPGPLLSLDETAMSRCGVSAQKISYIKGLSAAELKGELLLDQLDLLADDQAVANLMRLRGVGLWTAEIFLMFACRRLDLLPLGDLALRRAMQKHYAVSAGASASDYRAVAEHWRPFRSVASWYLWSSVD